MKILKQYLQISIALKQNFEESLKYLIKNKLQKE